jgi:hypothetical protein
MKAERAVVLALDDQRAFRGTSGSGGAAADHRGRGSGSRFPKSGAKDLRQIVAYYLP